ncbi:hypothetical protein QN382_23215, partial [Pseudomonas sp. 10B1]|nr:hypothetical protein [Pseudomonas sp. CCC4.3]MEB0222204.1 hypothetical protein [Pseudomonas sp. AB12(2023)]MEB0312165.1 hypothetical protein [Pseudomonas sp. 10B1]
MTAINSSYYAATAYRSDRMPDQPPSAERSWIRRFAKFRLPWGLTQEVALDDFLSEAAPEKLRRVEKAEQVKKEQLTLGTYVPAPYEHV